MRPLKPVLLAAAISNDKLSFPGSLFLPQIDAARPLRPYSVRIPMMDELHEEADQEWEYSAACFPWEYRSWLRGAVLGTWDQP